MRLDPQHARRHGRPEADRENRPERDRHLPEDLARLAHADDELDPVDELDRLDPPIEDGEERALGTLGRRVLAGRERDVRRRPREPLAVGLGEAGEDRDRPDLVCGDHPASLSPRRGRDEDPRVRARVPALTRRCFAQAFLAFTVDVPWHLPTNPSFPLNDFVAAAYVSLAVKYSPVPPSGSM